MLHTMKPTVGRYTTRRGIRLVAILVVLVALAAGCSGSGRPTPETWLPEWNAAVGVVPPEADLGEMPTRDTCNDVLAALRDARQGIEPTPYEAVDAPVRKWFEIAEAMFFECPPNQSGLDGFHQGYEQLDVFQAEVDAALAAEPAS
jgi:hypothetical protein